MPSPHVDVVPIRVAIAIHIHNFVTPRVVQCSAGMHLEALSARSIVRPDLEVGTAMAGPIGNVKSQVATDIDDGFVGSEAEALGGAAVALVEVDVVSMVAFSVGNVEDLVVGDVDNVELLAFR